ncbi:MAG: hypothetical protein NVSMB47_12110 [Polyangiales bacterium]
MPTPIDDPHSFDDLETEVHPPRGDPAEGFGPTVRWRDAAGDHESPVDGHVSIGSAPQNALLVVDPLVSRIHAELVVRDRSVWVRDLGSRNGSFVQSIRVEHACVPDGGVVRVGATELRVRYGTTAAQGVAWPEDRFGALVGGSAPMRRMYARLSRVAAGDAPVLIQGETGTGKEVVARALHDASPRRHGPFVIVDCGALPETLLDTELFGHTRGAFTGAVQARIGAFEAAHGGTLFIDEIGELPLTMQPKLLRVVETRTLRRIGETGTRPIDVRVLSATHRDLQTMVNAGGFREDLYFRLAVLVVAVPPLRERLEDIPQLVERFCESERGIEATPALIAELQRRPWLGNVRERRNAVTRASILGVEEALAEGSAPTAASREMPTVDSNRPFRDVREEWVTHLEREYIRALHERFRGNVAAIAKAAELDRTYIYRLLRKHDLLGR